MMTITNFSNWLKLYGNAWENKDTVKFVSLFSEDANYHWTPFEEPKRDRKEIKSAFESAVSTQDGIKFHYEILSFSTNIGICRWW